MSVGFGAVIAAAIALGLFSYTRVMAIDKNATTITADALPGVYVLGQLQVNIHRSLALLLEHANAGDAAEMSRLEADIQDLRSRNSAMLGEYSKTAVDERERPLFEALTAARTS